MGNPSYHGYILCGLNSFLFKRPILHGLRSIGISCTKRAAPWRKIYIPWMLRTLVAILFLSFRMMEGLQWHVKWCYSDTRSSSNVVIGCLRTILYGYQAISLATQRLSSWGIYTLSYGLVETNFCSRGQLITIFNQCTHLKSNLLLWCHFPEW